MPIVRERESQIPKGVKLVARAQKQLRAVGQRDVVAQPDLQRDQGPVTFKGDGVAGRRGRKGHRLALPNALGLQPNVQAHPTPRTQYINIATALHMWPSIDVFAVQGADGFVTAQE